MAVTLTEVFESLAESYTTLEENARTKLAKCLTDLTQGVDTSLIRTAMGVAAEALPYRRVLEYAEKVGVRVALTDVRKDLTRQLLSRSAGSSTCQIRNEAARMEVEAAQRFLANTDGLLDRFEDAPIEETGEQAEAEVEPAPAPAPVDVPTATPAQKRTLEAIRDNGVAIQELKVGRLQVTVERGERPRRDMVEWVVSQGWAKQAAASLYNGQAVTLTGIGEAILAR
ncbi:hypothetical protein [Streptomyces sp. NPDC006334]|uniref:hypothetical protein n=1 Tax=Streptomyces sp. NPDC006334 TaxID=3156754 RepID=UPI0033ABDB1F